MAWIESHQSLATHPKIRKLVRILGCPIPTIIGHLHLLWWWALDYAQDGEITQYDAFDIADACQWGGSAEDLYNALIECRFIDDEDGRLFLHDWHDYAGKLIEIRKKDAERKKSARDKKRMSSGSPPDIPRTSDGVLKESIRDLNLNQDLIITTTTTRAEPYRVFESEGFGTISSYIKDEIDELINEYGEQWVCEGMKRAVLRGKRSLSYVKGILVNWKADGMDDPWKEEKPNEQSGPRTKTVTPFRNPRTGEILFPDDELDELNRASAARLLGMQ